MMLQRGGVLQPRVLSRRWVIPDTPTLAKAPEDVGSARQFAIDAARLLANTRCHNVNVLDVTGISPITDFLVLATGTSPRQMKTAADEVEELGEPRDFRALSRVGDDSGTWICADFVNLVVHIFSPESRLYYDLDNLWGDGQKVEWRDPG